MEISRVQMAATVYLTSPWIPVEWVAAHGLVPRGLYAVPTLPSAPPAQGMCAFAHNAATWVTEHSSDAVVFASSCDQLRRAADLPEGEHVSRVFLFNLPATWQTDAVQELFRDELQRLSRFLVRLGGTAPTPATFAAIAAAYQVRRRQMLDAAGRLDGASCAKAMAHFHLTGEVCLPDAAMECSSAKVLIALLGGPAWGLDEGFWGMLARAGAGVGLNAMDSGERGLFPLWNIPAQLDEPAAALARACLASGADVFQRPNTALYEWLRLRLTERRIQGIVLAVPLNCDLWRGEAESLREAFSLPVLVLETQESHAGDPRMAGRLQAFVETLSCSARPKN